MIKNATEIRRKFFLHKINKNMQKYKGETLGTFTEMTSNSNFRNFVTL